MCAAGSLGCVIAIGAAEGGGHVRLDSQLFDLSTEAGWTELAAAATKQRLFQVDSPDKKRHRAYAFIAWAAESGATNLARRFELAPLIAEVSTAIANNERAPVPRSVDVFQLPWVHRRYAGSAILKGQRPASNVYRSAAPWRDNSEVHPPPSTFWHPPPDIAAQDLRAGFGRSHPPDYGAIIWEYHQPKTGFGGHGGFELKYEDQKIRAKFGEIHSEPFTARVFHALGYNVDPTDCVKGLKIRFTPRMFEEFNFRKPLQTAVTVAGILPVWTIQFQPRHELVDSVAEAVLKDGQRVNRARLRELLGKEGPRLQIDYIVTVPANVQSKPPDEKAVGPWDFGQLGHEDLRELRGAGLLAAWLGWFDSRFDNTRLRVIEDHGGYRLKHVFSDLGGGLGQCATGWSGWRGEDVDAFTEVFTEPEIRRGRGRMTTPFRIVNYRPIERTKAFEEMTVADARWMASLMAQLSEHQIREALSASGFDAQRVEQYAAKLMSRRTRLLKDLATTIAPQTLNSRR